MDRSGPFAELVARADRAGIFLDLDGTLAHIAPTPGEARPIEGAREALEELARRYRLVAVVSGRRAAEVAGVLGHPGRVRVLGLYGTDRGAEPDDLVGPAADARPDVERAAALVPGAQVERKGPNVAVHYRGAADHEAARRILLERLVRVAERHGLRVLEGKRVVELAPEAAPGKGETVLGFAENEGLRAVLYAGDDLADLDAFAALDALAARGVAAVKVAVRGPETPDGLLAAADVVVEGPPMLVALLRDLASDPR